MAANNGLHDYGHLGRAVHTFVTEYNFTDKLTNVIFESRLSEHFGWSSQESASRIDKEKLQRHYDALGIDPRIR
jgi:hypothetical protein